ncbi:MFS transporter [Burkholderia cepacia]|uniref:MFS transporter n=1 Tax=Burkholderia cepacia TaxID=292 RepID=UPI0018C4E1E0|nr:MFS transporter [Burkholderia cepacia]
MDDCDRRVSGDRVGSFRQKDNNPAAWLTGFVEGVPASTRILLVFQFLVNLSVFGALPLLAAFLDMERHLNASSVASVLTVNLLASRLLPLLLGASADRFSSRVLTTLGLLCRAAGFAGFAFARSLPGLLMWACLSGLGAALYETTAYSIFGSLDGAVRPKVFALNNLALNLGALIGPALLIVVPNTNGALPFLVSGAVFTALALIAPWIAGRSRHDVVDAHPLRGVLVAFGDRRFRRLCWSLVPFWTVYTQIYAFIPLTFSHGARLQRREAVLHHECADGNRHRLARHGLVSAYGLAIDDGDRACVVVRLFCACGMAGRPRSGRRFVARDPDRVSDRIHVWRKPDSSRVEHRARQPDDGRQRRPLFRCVGDFVGDRRDAGQLHRQRSRTLDGARAGMGHVHGDRTDRTARLPQPAATIAINAVDPARATCASEPAPSHT